jgi:hypothetical protein
MGVIRQMKIGIRYFRDTLALFCQRISLSLKFTGSISDAVRDQGDEFG